MFVKNKEMYHFHNNSNYDSMWQVGNTVDNSKNFISDYFKTLLDFKPNVFVPQEKDYFPLDLVIDEFLQVNQPTEVYIALLKLSSGFLKNYEIMKREIALEEYRELHFPNLPSRKQAIWLLDEEQLDFWMQELEIKERNGSLFKVSVTGELFKTCDTFLPEKKMSLLESYQYAEKYWNPDFTQVDESKTEYLFQGKTKILEKIL